MALDQIPGWFAAGEAALLWERGLDPDKHCSCGELLQECPIWSAVLVEGGAPGGPRAVEDYRDQATLLWGTMPRPMIGWLSNLPRQPVLSRRGTTAGPDGLDGAAVHASVLASVARVTEAQHIVDASKDPRLAWALWNAVGRDVDLRLFVVHLVRHPFAVVRSALRNPYGGRRPRHGAGAARRVAAHWVRVNHEADRLVRTIGPAHAITVRYEDFAVRPAEIVDAVTTLVGDAPECVPDLARGVPVDTNHIVSGGRARAVGADRGTLAQIELDEGWRDLSRRERRMVGLMAGPLARRFGYRVGIEGGVGG